MNTQELWMKIDTLVMLRTQLPHFGKIIERIETELRDYDEGLGKKPELDPAPTRQNRTPSPPPLSEPKHNAVDSGGVGSASEPLERKV